MAIPREDAEELLREADLPVTAAGDETLPLPRAEICRRLMEACADDLSSPITWEMSLTVLFYDRTPDSEEWDEFHELVEDRFGLPHIFWEKWDVATFGDLMLYVEGRLRHLWRAPDDANDQAA